MKRPHLLVAAFAASVSVAATPAHAQEDWSSETPPKPSAPDVRGPHVRVSLHASEGLVLQRRADDGDWYDECEAPCTKRVPIGASYRVEGPSVVGTAPFTIAAEPTDDVALQMVHERSRGVRNTGIAAIVLGSTAAAFGALGYGAAAASGAACSLGGALSAYSGTGSSSCSDSPTTPFAATMVVGAAMALAGGLVLAFQQRSRVDVRIAPR